METSISTNYAARVVADERIHHKEREPKVLERDPVNGLRALLRSLVRRIG